MEAPKCKICQQRHYGNCGPLGRKLEATSGSESSKPEVVQKTPAATDSSAGSNPAPAAKFDRVAYQREYMRKRRAATKGKQP